MNTKEHRGSGEESPGYGHGEEGPLGPEFRRFCSQIVIMVDTFGTFLKTSGPKGPVM